MNKILFRIGTDNQTLTRFGELGFIFRACYFRAKELGYNDDSIYIEWPLKLEYTVNHHLKREGKIIKNKIQKMTYVNDGTLPFKFIDNKNVIIKDYERVMNLIDENTFYKGSKPIYEYQSNGYIKRNHTAILDFLNKYFLKYGKRPIIKIKKDPTAELYILFHTRNALNCPLRNPNISTYSLILDIIKQRYHRYNIYRCGEKLPYEEYLYSFQCIFDKYFPQDKSINNFIKLIANAKLFIGCTAGPVDFARGFGIPILELDIPSVAWDCENMDGYYSKRYWKEYMKAKYGETIDDCIDQNLVLKIFQGEKKDICEIIKFMDKWL